MGDVLIKQLMNFGFSEKEAKVYLALLELELATVFQVAKESGINRSSAYVVLESLRKKGFVGISEDRKVRRYLAASPETLLYAAKSAARKQEDIQSNIESIVPQLKALHKSTKRRPVVKVFEGENGAKEVYWDLFATKTKDLRTFANLIDISRRVPDFLEAHDKERGKRGIKMYAINPATKEMRGLIKYIKPSQPAEVALIPEDKYKLTSDMGIYGNKVSFVSPKDNFGVIIESKEIADTLRNCFDLAWEEAKRSHKKYKISRY